MIMHSAPNKFAIKHLLQNARILFLFAVMFYVTENLSAAVVFKNNGDILTGNISSETKDKIKLKTRYGTLTIEKKIVLRVILDEKNIPVEKVNVDGKATEVRQVEANTKEKIYLTEEGKVIRIKAESPDAKPETEKKADQPNVKNTQIALSGTFSRAQVAVFDERSGLKQVLETKQGLSGAALDFAYCANSYISYNLRMTFDRVSLTKEVLGQQGKFTNENTTSYYSFLPGMGLSALGNNNLQSSFFDLGIRVNLGISMIDAANDFKTQKTTTLSGVISPFTLAGDMYFSVRISESLALTLSGGAQYYFYNSIYNRPENPPPPVEPGFAALVSANDQTFDNPYLMALRLGIVYTF